MVNCGINTVSTGIINKASNHFKRFLVPLHSTSFNKNCQGDTEANLIICLDCNNKKGIDSNRHKKSSHNKLLTK